MISSKVSSSNLPVLIAEDNEVNSFLLQKIFEQQGHETIIFTDGLSAFKAFQEKFYALLILDIGLPAMDGLSLCRKIRGLPGGKNCFILIYTGYSDTEKLSAAIEAGADDFLNKGTSPKMFRLRIEIALRTIRSQMERHQAAISIRESEQKARAIIDASPDVVLMVDKNGTILDSNEMLTKVMDSKRSALIGENIFSFYSDPIAKSRKAYLDQAILTRKTVHYEDNIENIHFKHNIYPIIESDDSVEKIVIYSTDITREKQLSSQRKESEERFRHLFEYTSVPLWERDYSYVKDELQSLYEKCDSEDSFFEYFESKKGAFWELIFSIKTINVNQASVDIFGSKDAKQFIEKTSDIIFEKSIPAMLQIFKTIGQKKKILSGEIELQRFDKTCLNMLYQWVVMPGAETDYSRVLISMIDITALKNTEQNLRNERNFNDAILDNANTMIMVTDWYGKIVRFNRTCQLITGYKEKEVLNKLYWETNFSDNSDLSTKETFFDFIRKTGNLNTFESTWITKSNKKCLISWSITTMGEKDDHPLHVVFVGMDITEKRKAENEAKQRQQQLMQADKMVALGTLVSGVAHEINNPTGIISLNGPMLKKGWDSFFSILDKNKDIAEIFKQQGVSIDKIKKRTPFLIEQIIDSARRIKRIVSELKDYARQDLTDMNQVLDLNDVVKTSVNLVINKIKKSTHDYSFQYYPNKLMVKGNFQRLEQIFINVLINACEALSDTSQSITVNTSQDESSKCAIVEIKDQGIGISEQALKKLFDPFFTTKRDNGGTGLGMAVSHVIIEEHGGTIQYISEPGKGTICQIKIPLDS